MACLTLDKSRKLSCTVGSAGIKAIGLIEWSEDQGITEDAGLISALDVAKFPVSSIIKLQLKNNGNTYVEEITRDTETRSYQFVGNLSVVLQGLDVDTRNMVLELVKGEVLVFIELNDGVILVTGVEAGSMLTGGNFATGGARLDSKGSTMSFSSSDSEPYRTLDAAAVSTYESAIIAYI